MKRTTREWVGKAEDDYQLAAQGARLSRPFHDQVCFHCQQAAEKYLNDDMLLAVATFELAAGVAPRSHKERLLSPGQTIRDLPFQVESAALVIGVDVNLANFYSTDKHIRLCCGKAISVAQAFTPGTKEPTRPSILRPVHGAFHPLSLLEPVSDVHAEAALTHQRQ